jgi:hypothetical protein
MSIYVYVYDPSLSHLVFCISSYHRQLTAGLQLSRSPLCPLQTAHLPSPTARSRGSASQRSLPATGNCSSPTVSELHHALFSSCTPSILLRIIFRGRQIGGGVLHPPPPLPPTNQAGDGQATPLGAGESVDGWSGVHHPSPPPSMAGRWQSYSPLGTTEGVDVGWRSPAPTPNSNKPSS